MEDTELQHRVKTLEKNVQQLQDQVNTLAVALGKAERVLTKSPYAGGG